MNFGAFFSPFFTANKLVDENLKETLSSIHKIFSFHANGIKFVAYAYLLLIYLTRIPNTDDKTSQELLVTAVTYYYGTHTTSPAVVLLLWRTDRLCLVLSSVHRIYFSWSSSEVLYRHTRMKMTPKEFYRINPSSSKLQLCSVILSQNLLLLLLLHVVIRDKLWNMCLLHTILKFEAFSKALCNNFLLKIGIFDVWDIRKVFLFLKEVLLKQYF